MDILLSAITCNNCRKILTTPILLPCGHSICKYHSNVATEKITCSKCGISHKNKGFVHNLALSEVISSQVGSMNFGPCHKTTKNACDKLDQTLSELSHILDDPGYFTYTVIDDLRKKVLLKEEEMKQEMEKIFEWLLDVLDEYRIKCESNLKDPSCVTWIDNLRNRKNSITEELNKWYSVLNQFDFDDEEWIQIKKKCDEQDLELQKDIESLKAHILVLEDGYKFRVEVFLKASLYSIHEFKSLRIDSKILNQNQQNELIDLCKISRLRKFSLCYRGSRDGFGASNFHSKCDDLSKTLTVIETTKGYIFGGYTEKKWNKNVIKPLDGILAYAQDANAYIFSLVNYLGGSFVMPIEKTQNAIARKQSYGPTFGSGHDIHISDNSNTSNNSYSKIKSYKLNLEDEENILAGSEYFQVREIEVFQLK